MTAVVYFNGADQEWYRKPWHRISGCGPATAANMLAIYSRKDGSQSGLYAGDSDTFNIKDFIKHMDRVRRYVVPGPFGLTSATAFARFLSSYGDDAKCRLRPEIKKGLATRPEIEDYVKEELLMGKSLAMLILRHRDSAFDDFNWHWMNVTNLDTKAGSMSIGTYGERYEIDIERLLAGTDPLKNIKFVSL